MKRPIGLSNPWSKTKDLLHPPAPNGERVWAWGWGASSLGGSSQQIHCCPLLEASWEEMARRPWLEVRPLKTCCISRSHGSSRLLALFCFSVGLDQGVSHFRNMTGKRDSYLYVTSLNGLLSTDLQTFNVQKAVYLTNTGKSLHLPQVKPTGTSYCSEGF